MGRAFSSKSDRPFAEAVPDQTIALARSAIEHVSIWRHLVVVAFVAACNAMLSFRLAASWSIDPWAHIGAAAGLCAAALSARWIAAEGAPAYVTAASLTSLPFLALPWLRPSPFVLGGSISASRIPVHVSSATFAGLCAFSVSALIGTYLAARTHQLRHVPHVPRLWPLVAAVVGLVGVTAVGALRVSRVATGAPRSRSPSTIVPAHSDRTDCVPIHTGSWSRTGDPVKYCLLPRHREGSTTVERVCNLDDGRCEATVALDGFVLCEPVRFDSRDDLVIRIEPMASTYSIAAAGKVLARGRIPPTPARAPRSETTAAAVPRAIAYVAALPLAAVLLWLWLTKRRVVRVLQGRQALLREDGRLERGGSPPALVVAPRCPPGLVITFAEDQGPSDYRSAVFLEDARLVSGTKYQHIMRLVRIHRDVAPLALMTSVLLAWPLLMRALH